MPTLAEIRRRARVALILRATGDWSRRPHPGQRYKHGWRPTAFGIAADKLASVSDNDLAELLHDPELDDPDSDTYTSDYVLAVVRESAKRATDRPESWNAAERRALTNRRRRETAKARRDAELQQRLDDFIAQGLTEDEAWSKVTGKDLAKERAWDLAGRRKGESYEQALRRAYWDEVDQQVAESESTVVGYFLSNDGKRALAEARREAKRNGKTFSFIPADLWSMPEAQAMAWASDELKEYWESKGGRLTFAAWRAQVET